MLRRVVPHPKVRKHTNAFYQLLNRHQKYFPEMSKYSFYRWHPRLFFCIMQSETVIIHSSWRASHMVEPSTVSPTPLPLQPRLETYSLTKNIMWHPITSPTISAHYCRTESRLSLESVSIHAYHEAHHPIICFFIHTYDIYILTHTAPSHLNTFRTAHHFQHPTIFHRHIAVFRLICSLVGAGTLHNDTTYLIYFNIQSTADLFPVSQTLEGIRFNP